MMKTVFACIIMAGFSLSLLAQATMKTPVKPTSEPWPLEKSQAILEKTQTITLSPNLSHLTAAERQAVTKLLEVGKLFQQIYEEQRHPQAISSINELTRLDKNLGSPRWTQNLLVLYRLNQGPIATTLENKREPFLAVDPPQPGVNMYPWGITRQEVDQFLAKHPEQQDRIFDLRTVVRRSNAQSLQRDLNKLKQYPALVILNPGLKQELETALLRKEDGGLYAVPYAVAYADQLVRASQLLFEAADAVQRDDEEFARYLRNRGRDLLSNDYESGDAAWVTGRFKHLNAQIGSYEVYDDALMGVKTFFAFSLLSNRDAETEALRKAMKDLQALENSLPYEHHKRVREDIPVGVYDVIADFGQARGGNTATILPNESYLARRYGRTILLRANIMRNADIFASSASTWAAAVAPAHKDELTADGGFYRTLWHEVGHYLGVDRTKDGEDLDAALQDTASLLEEMKADLVALYTAEALHKQGYYTSDQLRSLYAGGILRVLQNNRPRRDQPYNTMQLMQWNFFLENGLLSFDGQSKRLLINYDKYHDVVGQLLKKVLDVQYQGDRAAAEKFIQQYTTWDENLHGAVAANIRAQQKYRFRVFNYKELGE
jgi:hypothetical protein